jgi:hypothetical protein
MAIALTCVACGGPLSREENRIQKELMKQYLQIGEKEMERTLKEKYGKKLNVTDLVVPTYVDQCTGESNGIYKPFVVGKVKYDNKEYDVCIDIDDGLVCYDNIQHQQITDAFKSWLLEGSALQPYYLVFDVGLTIEGLPGMNHLYYDDDIEKFIERGGCDSVIAFYDGNDVANMPNDILATLKSAHYAFLAQTSGNRFGDKEAEEIREKHMLNEHLPQISIYWISIDGIVKYKIPKMFDMGEALYYNEDYIKSIAVSETTAPEDCIEAIEQAGNLKVVTMWYYVKDEKSVIYLRKANIPDYDEDKTYYVIKGISQTHGGHKAVIEEVEYRIGEYLVVECAGLNNWYAVCQLLGN